MVARSLAACQACVCVFMCVRMGVCTCVCVLWTCYHVCLFLRVCLRRSYAVCLRLQDGRELLLACSLARLLATACQRVRACVRASDCGKCSEPLCPRLLESSTRPNHITQPHHSHLTWASCSPAPPWRHHSPATRRENKALFTFKSVFIYKENYDYRSED